MTQMLASVRNRQEAEIVFDNGADIIDLKDPASGAMGAVKPDKLLEVIEFVAGRKPVSAACGDLAMEPELVRKKVEEFASTGVDFVKIGLFPSHHLAGCLDALKPLAQHGKLIAVLFADYRDSYDRALQEELAAAGFHGAMLDTADKSAGRLLDHMTPDQVGKFVRDGQSHGLVTGVAGSLEAPDIPRLLSYSPDVIGFRGALCAGLDRNARIDGQATAKIRALIPKMQETDAPASVDYKLLAARGYFPDPAEAGLGTDKI
ncbi:MAG: (5-formylfuran-3-yl)methyl phosphate synthase, partial [Phyllobacterium sp.]